MQQFSKVIHLNDVDLSYKEYKKYKEEAITLNTTNHKYIGFKGADCVIISIENHNPISKENLKELKEFDKEKNIYPIILLRSPYCHFSSMWKKYKTLPFARTYELQYPQYSIPKLIKLWEVYAHIFLKDKNNRFVKVLYDEFVINKEYRLSFLDKLGIQKKYIDNTKRIRFQDSSFEDKNKEAQVYKDIDTCIYKDNPEFVKIFCGSNIDSLWKKIIK